jgi:hypothetical protein
VDRILGRRLAAQQLVKPRFRAPEDLVRWFGAMQAQDYLGSLWAVGQRLPDGTEACVEQAIASRRLVRTWPMRGTLHLVAALERAGVSAAGQRGIHLLGFHAQQGLVCIGPRRGRQPVFVLVDEWLPPAPHLEGEAALREMARRYFQSHGPATAEDFAWWAGLTRKEVAVAMDGLPTTDARPARGRQAALLPAWDEYLVAYKDRSAAMGHLPPARLPGPMATGRPTIVIDGRVVGSWSRRLGPRGVRVRYDWWVAPSPAERRLVEKAAQRYATFLGPSA